MSQIPFWVSPLALLVASTQNGNLTHSLYTTRVKVRAGPGRSGQVRAGPGKLPSRCRKQMCMFLGRGIMRVGVCGRVWRQERDNYFFLKKCAPLYIAGSDCKKQSPYMARDQRRRRVGGVFERVPRPEWPAWLEEQEQKPPVLVPPNNPVVEEFDPLLPQARIVEEDLGEWERWGTQGKGRNRELLKRCFFTRDLEDSLVSRMLDKIRQLCERGTSSGCVGVSC